jgi:hypothetical protein
MSTNHRPPQQGERIDPKNLFFFPFSIVLYTLHATTNQPTSLVWNLDESDEWTFDTNVSQGSGCK